MTAGVGTAAAGAAQAAAAVLAATLNYKVAQQAQNRLDKLAAYTLYNLDIDKGRSETFKACIDQTLAEMCDTPRAVLQTDAVVARAHAVIEADLARALRKNKECMSIYCAPMSRSNVAGLLVAAAATKAEVSSAEIRREEMRVRLLDDHRFERKLSVGKVTRGNFDGSINASRALMGMYEHQATAASGALAGSLQTLGYALKRNFGTEDNTNKAPELSQEYRDQVTNSFDDQLAAAKNVSKDEFGGDTPSYQYNETPLDTGKGGGTDGTNPGTGVTPSASDLADLF